MRLIDHCQYLHSLTSCSRWITLKISQYHSLEITRREKKYNYVILQIFNVLSDNRLESLPRCWKQLVSYIALIVGTHGWGTKRNQPWVPTMYCPGPQEIKGIELLPAPRGKELCPLTSQTLNNGIIVDYCYYSDIFCDGLLHFIILYDNLGALRNYFNLDFHNNTFGTLSAMIPMFHLWNNLTDQSNKVLHFINPCPGTIKLLFIQTKPVLS